MGKIPRNKKSIKIALLIAVEDRIDPNMTYGHSLV